jgi:cytochrome c556
MTSSLKLAALLACVLSGAAFAQDKPKQMTTQQMQQAMATAKKMAMQERSSMMEETKQIDAQITQLQSQVRALQQQLAQPPKYFDAWNVNTAGP